MEMSEPTARAYGQFLDGMSEIERDRMEPCAHCGKVWYAIHHTDGLCHECLPIVRSKRTQFRVVLWASLAVLAFTAIVSIFGGPPG